MKTKPRYKEDAVKCFGASEHGPMIELASGRRVYGLPAAAPDLLHAAKLAYELLFRHPGTPEHGTAMTAICSAIAKAEEAQP